MTDHGAHHIDIAQWGLDMDESGPVEIDGKATFPTAPGAYNVASKFEATLRYANGAEVLVLDEGRNGVLFEGELGRIFVNRGTIAGKPVDDLKENPLERERFKLYAHDNLSRPPRTGKYDSIVNHMGNFYDCLQTRQLPLSNVYSQHRTVSVCHLGNISMRLGRKLRWDPAKESFLGDDEANTWLRREPRKGFGVDA
jgi:predicted dehydrogenase